MPILVIVRHGQSVWNLENRFTGDVDVDLSSLGEKEAINAGRILKHYEFDTAYTSVLRRAIRTLDLILQENAHPNVPSVQNTALNERRYGDLQGLNKSETEGKYGLKQVLLWRRSYEVTPPGGESLQDTFNRTIPFYQKSAEPKLTQGKDILIVAHGNSLRALMMYLENISPEKIADVNLATGIPRRYEFSSDMKMLNVRYLSWD